MKLLTTYVVGSNLQVSDPQLQVSDPKLYVSDPKLHVSDPKLQAVVPKDVFDSIDAFAVGGPYRTIKLVKCG